MTDSTEQSWDETYDVVVVGSGNGALTAAIASIVVLIILLYGSRLVKLTPDVWQ